MATRLMAQTEADPTTIHLGEDSRRTPEQPDLVVFTGDGPSLLQNLWT